MPITIGPGTRTLTRAVAAFILGLIAQHATAQTIQGTAAYRERIAMPDGAVFEATLEDVSRADAPASVIASTRLSSPGNPPIKFSIDYAPAKSSPTTVMPSELDSCKTESSCSRAIPRHPSSLAATL